MSYSAPLPGTRVTFSCVAKRKSPKRRPSRCCVFRPPMDEKSDRAGRACRRAIHGAAASGRNPLRSRFARVRFAPPAGLFIRPSPQHRGPENFASMAAIVALLEARSSTLLRPSRAQDARRMEPLGCGARSAEMPAGWRTGGAPVRRRHRDVPSANPAECARTRSPWMGEGRIRGVAFLLVTSLWPSKEKLPAPPGGARKKTWTSCDTL